VEPIGSEGEPDSTIPPESADLTNQKVILSIEIALFADLPHAEIMSDIEAAIKEMKRLNLKFNCESRSYLSVSGEQLKCYALDRDAMFALIINYSRVARAKIIKHWVDNISNPEDTDAVPPVEPIVEPVVEPEVEQEAEPVVEADTDDDEAITFGDTEKTLTVFDFEENVIRTVIDDDGETLFFAKDVCGVLGYANARKAVSDHCKEKGVTKRDTLSKGGKQQAIFINEPNLMRLVVKSKLPAAEKFEAWVFEEVLPTIRKTGKYEIPKVEPKESSLLEKLMTNNAIIKEALCGFNMLGVEGNQAALGANKLAAQETGFNILEMIGQSAIVSPVQERYYTPTQLGDNYKMTAQAFNNLLLEKGYQVKNGDKWAATEKGKQFSVVTDTNKKNSTGTVQQLFWYESIIKEIGI
jgi:prophage antirepressor-like protein